MLVVQNQFMFLYETLQICEGSWECWKLPKSC